MIQPNLPEVELATDDWPFLYLMRSTMPQDYLVVIGTLLILSLVVMVALRGRTFASGDGHFLFLG